MVMSNIGTIIAHTAQHSTSPSSSTSVAFHVQLMSMANTVTRLLTGPVADWVSPALLLMADADPVPTRRKRYVSRVVFVSASCALFFLAFGWMAVGVRSSHSVWVLSLGTGAGYGMLWWVPHLFPLLSADSAAFVSQDGYSFSECFCLGHTERSTQLW